MLVAVVYLVAQLKYSWACYTSKPEWKRDMLVQTANNKWMVWSDAGMPYRRTIKYIMWGFFYLTSPIRKRYGKACGW